MKTVNLLFDYIEMLKVIPFYLDNMQMHLEHTLFHKIN